MDQELKQRLIGAAVITALATIFVPMLFDDPIDETGKSINELKIPELPAKAQDVEIMPLPEKVEDVATTAPAEKPTKPAVAAVAEGEDADFAPAKPKLRLSAKDTQVNTRPVPSEEPDAVATLAEPDDAAAEAEVVRPVIKPVTKPATLPAAPVVTAAPKVAKPVSKPIEPELAEPAVATPKPAVPAGAEAQATRLYLNAGSFGQKANAVALQDTLKQQGFASTIKEVTTDKGTVFKVRIGPMLDKAKAQAVKAKLAQINVNSFVSGDE